MTLFDADGKPVSGKPAWQPPQQRLSIDNVMGMLKTVRGRVHSPTLEHHVDLVAHYLATIIEQAAQMNRMMGAIRVELALARQRISELTGEPLGEEDVAIVEHVRKAVEARQAAAEQDNEPAPPEDAA